MKLRTLTAIFAASIIIITLIAARIGTTMPVMREMVMTEFLLFAVVFAIISIDTIGAKLKKAKDAYDYNRLTNRR